MPEQRPCERCGGRGYLTKPCPLCGAFRDRGGSGVVKVESLWGRSAPPVAPKRRPRAEG